MAVKSLGVGLGVPAGVSLRVIYGTGDKYFAGSDGHIYCESHSRNTAYYPQPFRLQESVGSNGYCFVNFIVGGKKSSKLVHTLICSAFKGPKTHQSLCVRHGDGNKGNNDPKNLEWGTYSENEADKKRHGTAAIGARQGSAKLTDEAVRIIRASIPFGLWNTKDAASVFGVTPSRISAIARGIGWEHIA